MSFGAEVLSAILSRFKAKLEDVSSLGLAKLVKYPAHDPGWGADGAPPKANRWARVSVEFAGSDPFTVGDTKFTDQYSGLITAEFYVARASNAQALSDVMTLTDAFCDAFRRWDNITASGHKVLTFSPRPIKPEDDGPWARVMARVEFNAFGHFVAQAG